MPAKQTIAVIGAATAEGKAVLEHLPHSKIVFLQLPHGAAKLPVISGGNKPAAEAVRNLFETANSNQ